MRVTLQSAAKLVVFFGLKEVGGNVGFAYLLAAHTHTHTQLWGVRSGMRYAHDICNGIFSFISTANSNLNASKLVPHEILLCNHQCYVHFSLILSFMALIPPWALGFCGQNNL